MLSLSQLLMRNEQRRILLRIAIFLAMIIPCNACQKTSFTEVSTSGYKTNALTVSQKPNIVLILADDIGYEVPTYTGGQSYRTPKIDQFASGNMQFTQCQAAPNCSPTRVMLMTGKYNFRNYSKWGVLDTSQYTIANLLHDAGYATCVAGKWQLDGGDASIRKFGFDKYQVFLPYTPETIAGENAQNWYRYKDPHIYEKGAFLPDSLTNGKYADDMFVDYISKFIDSNVTKPFFVYYPMSLCHYPFCPPPNNPDFATWTPESHITDTSYFPYMVNYMDRKINEIIKKINKKGLTNNTVILFVGDNGTPSQITSKFRGQVVPGGKGTTTQYGTHVPFIVSWPGNISAGAVNNNIINFTDFLPLLADIAGIPVPTNHGIIDGISFYTSFFNPHDTIREWGFCHWQPYTTSPLRRWSQTVEYKLYDSINQSKFYNLITDTLETHAITNKAITPDERLIKQQLQSVLDQMNN